MSKFSEEEVRFLTSAKLLGRLATLDPDGSPHLVPIGWHFDPDTEDIEISGRSFASTRKYRNVQRDPRVAFLVDEVLPPWRPRSVMIRGTAEARDGVGNDEARIRIRAEKVTSWGL